MHKRVFCWILRNALNAIFIACQLYMLQWRLLTQSLLLLCDSAFVFDQHKMVKMQSEVMKSMRNWYGNRSTKEKNLKLIKTLHVAINKIKLIYSIWIAKWRNVVKDREFRTYTTCQSNYLFIIFTLTQDPIQFCNWKFLIRENWMPSLIGYIHSIG